MWHHLLCIAGDGVKGCTCNVEKRMELTKLHMRATDVYETVLNNDRPFKIPRVLSSSNDVQDSVNQSQLNQVESQAGSTPERKKSASAAAIEQIRKIYNVVHRDEADDAIADFFMANGISFNATHSPYYKEIVKKILAVGQGYTPPGYNKMRTSLLDKGVTRMQGCMVDLKQSWTSSGCSIVMDGWIDIQHRPLLNIIVTSPAGP